MAGLDRARRHRRRGGLIPDAAGLAPHPRADRRGAAPGTVFVSREPTGETWRGEARDDDLILTRILTLDGLEDGVNRGAGCDSLERYIYLHGTNHEDLLGRPALAWLRAAVERRMCGNCSSACAKAISCSSPRRKRRRCPIPRAGGRFHYAGLGGAGMSALAQFQAMTGRRVSGSDRAFDHGERAGLRAQLERLGIAVLPQDGSGLGPDCAALVVSTAVEEQVADVAAARAQRHPHHPSLGAAGAFRGAGIARSP